MSLADLIGLNAVAALRRRTMDAILGMELPLLIKFVVSFAIVLLLIGVAALLVRKFGGKALIPGATQRGRLPRLAVVDKAQVDSRRSLVIVRRDNVEHLLLIGGPTDVLVESNISGAAIAPVRQPEAEVRGPAIEPVAVSRAAVAAPAVPQIEDAPVRAEPAIKPEPRLDVRAEPVLMPEPWPEAEVRVPQVPAFAPAPPPAVVRADVLEPDVFAEPRQPQVPPVIVPPLVTAIPPLPAAAIAQPALEEPLARFAQDLDDAHREHMNGQIKPPQPAVQVPPIAAAPSPRPIEPALADDQSLADMAQRLEAALRRPLGANGTRTVPQQPQPAPRMSATVSVRQPAPMRRTPTVAPPIPPQPAAARPAAPPVVPAQPQTSAEEAATYENLQREMASLLGRKPGSS
jgi:hypothetical protein